MRELCRVWAPSEQMHESKERTALSKLDSREQIRKGVELKINFSTSGYWLHGTMLIVLFMSMRR